MRVVHDRSMWGQLSLAAALDVVPDDAGQCRHEVREQGLAAFFLVRRPRGCSRPQTGNRHEQHDQGCRLAAAAASCGDEEDGSVRQEGSLDQGQCGGEEDALAGEVGGDVDQPFVGQELERAADSGIVALFARRQDGQQLLRHAEDDTAIAIQTWCCEETAVGENDRQGGDRGDDRQGVVASRVRK